MFFCSQIISIIITVGVFRIGRHSRSNTEDEDNVRRRSKSLVARIGMSVFKIALIQDPYHLTSDHYQYLLVLSLSVLSVVILWELMYLDLYQHTERRWNPAFECSWGLDYPPECVVYLELLIATLIVLLATLFINIAICRRPTQIRSGNDNFGVSKRKSLQALKEKLKGGPKRSGKVTLYYKFAIDAMEEVRDSRAPSSIPWQKSWGFIIVSCLWTTAMIGMSFVVHADIVLDFLNPGKGGVTFTYIRRVISILLSYFIVVIFLRFFMRTMYRLNAMLHKGILSILHTPYFMYSQSTSSNFKTTYSTAFMLMKIPSNPMSFIVRNDSKNPEQPTVPDAERKDDQNDQEEQTKEKDSKSTEQVNDEESKYEEQNSQRNDDGALNSSEVEEAVESKESEERSREREMARTESKRELEALKSKIEALEKTLMVKESGTDAGIEKDEKEEKKPKDVAYLDYKTQYLDPTFMMAWWTLRQHIEQYELCYFFEVGPISKISTLPIRCALNDHTADESNHFL